MPEHRSSVCNKNLFGHPKIRFEGEVYCYLCAKEIVGEQDFIAEAAMSRARKQQESEIAQHDAWQKHLRSALPAKDTQRFIIWGFGIGFFVFSDHQAKSDASMVGSFLLGLGIGFVLNHFYVQLKRANWIRRNPEPTFSSFPFATLAGDRIELVGGTKGKQISGSYRQRILERDGYRCQNCGRVFPSEQLEVHHIKSRSNRGKNFSTNLVTLCFDCHLDEGWFGHSHYMRQWYRRKPGGS